MYLAFWIGWGLIGLAFTVAVFAWAVRTRQFSQSRRAALLPFDDISPEDSPPGVGERRSRGNAILATIFIVAGLLFTVVMLVVAVMSL
jgi:hypothetical protein